MDYITSVCSVLALFLAYFAISREGRDDLKSTLRRVYLVAKRIWVLVVLVLALLFPLAVMGSSLAAFWQFISRTGPITRHEAVMLFVHFFNLVMYFALFLTVVMVLIKARKELMEAKSKRESSSE